MWLRCSWCHRVTVISRVTTTTSETFLSEPATSQRLMHLSLRIITRSAELSSCFSGDAAGSLPLALKIALVTAAVRSDSYNGYIGTCHSRG